MQYHASISTKGVNANTKGGLIHGMSYGNTAITPRTLVVSLQRVKAQYDQNAGQLIGNANIPLWSSRSKRIALRRC